VGVCERAREREREKERVITNNTMIKYVEWCNGREINFLLKINKPAVCIEELKYDVNSDVYLRN